MTNGIFVTSTLLLKILNSSSGLFASKNLTSLVIVLLELMNKNFSDFDFDTPMLNDSSFSS